MESQQFKNVGAIISSISGIICTFLIHRTRCTSRLKLSVLHSYYLYNPDSYQCNQSYANSELKTRTKAKLLCFSSKMFLPALPNLMLNTINSYRVALVALTLISLIPFLIKFYDSSDLKSNLLFPRKIQKRLICPKASLATQLVNNLPA